MARSAIEPTATNSFECRHLHPDGTIVWVLVNIVPERDATGTITGYMGTLTDISERKQAETALRESESQLQSLANLVPDLLWDSEPDGSTNWYNQRWMEYTGQTFEQAIGWGWVDTIHPDDREGSARRYREAVAQGMPLQQEHRIRRHDGSYRWFVVNASPLKDESGKVIKMYGAATDIHERKRAEIGTQANLEIALEAAQMGIWYWDASRDIAPVRSLRHDRIFGYDTLQPEWGQEIARRHVVAADRSIFDAALERSMTTGEIDFEVRVQWPDGSIHWMAARGQFDFDRDGNVTHGYGVNFDITDRKQAEAELQAQQRLIEQVTASTTAILYIYDSIESQTIYANAQVETILGYTPATICAMGANLLDLVHPDDIPALLAALERRAGAADGEIVESEYRMQDVNGEWHWLQSRDRVLNRTADGAVKQTIGTAIDITDRKQSAQKIQEQAALLDVATDAIFVRDLEHRILYWNRGAERLYGWTATEAIGQLATELLGGNPAKVAENTQAVFDLGEWRGEIHKVNKAGEDVIVEGRWTLVRDESGRAKSILCVNTDITAKKSLEAQFYHAQRLESLGTLASGIAHDLNNILTPILAFAQILRLQPEIDQKSRGWLQIIEDSARRTADLVGQILTFARGAIGKHIVLQVNHLLEDLIKVARQTFPKSIVIERHLADNLWLLNGDATQLHQVFLNLCVNARDAMPNGGILTISAENYVVDKLFARLNLNVCAGNYVLVTISDTGTGIPPEILDRIFDPFFTTKPIGEGTGLGLASVLGIVNNYGGFVRVASVLGKGTEFKIYLPAATESETTNIQLGSELVDGNDELILIVDDDPAVRAVNRSLLEEHHYRTLIASDGIEAMAVYALHKSSIDLVLTDAMMPKLGGAAAIRAMCQMNPHVKIVAISGLSSNQAPMLEAGAKVFLAKPYQLAELLRTISELLNS